MADTVMTLMPQICAWLEANGIRPGDVPVDEVPEIRDGQIHVTLFRRDAEGRHYVEPGAERAAKVRRSFPLQAQPPPALRPWLAGQVPAP